MFKQESGGVEEDVRRRWRRYAHRVLASEISRISRYVDRIVQCDPLPHDDGALIRQLGGDSGASQRIERQHADDVVGVLLNGNLNHSHDVEGELKALLPKLERGDRVIIVAFNPYFRGLYKLASRFGVRKGELPDTFVTTTDLKNLAALAGYEVTRVRPALFSPFRLLGFGAAANALLPVVPVLRELALTNVIVLRPKKALPDGARPTLSIVIPARNEKGNIEQAVRRLLPFKDVTDIEIIFVEGHSTDDTWSEIQRVVGAYSNRVTVRAYQQPGKGKADAVRHGFSKATGELLTILDADLTMPPEMIGRFYDAYCKGLADFVNGSRLVYPMEGEAMRFLNHLGNVFFAKALSSALGVRLGDSLCGTKLVRRKDYERMRAWRRDFGDFDPFGDFELLFPAASLGLGVIDVPVRYRARTYGETNIHRFRHGLILLRMTLTGFAKITVGPWT